MPILQIPGTLSNQLKRITLEEIKLLDPCYINSETAPCLPTNKNYSEGNLNLIFNKSVQTRHGMIHENTLSVSFGQFESRFGHVLIGSSESGICWIDFFETSLREAVNNLKRELKNAHFNPKETEMQYSALEIINDSAKNNSPVMIHLIGTDFQIKIWEILTRIPLGQLSSYGQIANLLNKPGASRAIGTAIGSNKIGYVIPCHRVVTSSGKLGGFRWGLKKKAQMLSSEFYYQEELKN